MKNYELIFVVLVLFLSCGTRKEKSYHREEVRIDSLSVIRRDSSTVQGILNSVSGQKLEVCHITYSQPDSLFRQHVQAVTVLKALSIEEKEEEVRMEAAGKETIHYEHESLIKEQECVKTNKRFPFRQFIIGLGFGFIFLLYFRMKKRKTD